MAVALHCTHYTSSAKNSDQDELINISCESCLNWDGKKCTIGVYDDVLSSLDQT
ncbi:MAG TPA: hypothetical protein GXX38_04635 [Clostridia bacterium]|nr:hypothetical protein [Clostridia bacterium]